VNTAADRPGGGTGNHSGETTRGRAESDCPPQRKKLRLEVGCRPEQHGNKERTTRLPQEPDDIPAEGEENKTQVLAGTLEVLAEY
jgi:hypothetical protein